MEGAGEVERQELGQIDPEEVPELGPVVLGGRAHHRLDQEQRGHHQEEPSAGALRRGERHISGSLERERGLLAAVPAEEVPAPERGEQQADASQQRNQGDDAPEDYVRGRPVVDELLGWPVVRVRVVVPGPAGRGRPSRPREERRELVHPLGVVDRVGEQAELRGRIAEVLGVVALQLFERLGLLRGERERVGL